MIEMMNFYMFLYVDDEFLMINFKRKYFGCNKQMNYISRQQMTKLTTFK